MVQNFGLVAMRVLEWVFFVGLAGCLTTVLLSWISVWQGGMNDEE